MKTDTPPTIYLKDYTPSNYLVDTIDLNFVLGEKKTTVMATSVIRPNSKADQKGGSLKLNGEQLKLLSIKINGKALSDDDYQLSDKFLEIKNPPKAKFTLEITTTCNPAANKALSGLYISSGNYCTQCEAEGFRRITYSLDRPDVLSVYTVRIEGDKELTPVLLSNGNPLESGDLKGGKHFSIWHDPHPKPTYLFALVAGQYARVTDHFTTMKGKKVELNIYTSHGKEDRCDWAMDSLKRSMKWDERRFDREYDLDVFNIAAVPDFNMGAMENKGLNIFNDKLVLARPDTATDSDYLAIESVIAHEYFHNWTGNRITCRDWFQLCLKEGLTVYRDQEFTADEHDDTVYRIMEVRRLKASQFPEDGGPLAHPVRPDHYIEINNFYTATVYQKGAELCRMLATILGEAGFKKGMDLYFKRHDGQAATVEYFVGAMQDANKKQDLGQFMLWYEQAGTPLITADYKYDGDKRIGALTLSQETAPTPKQDTKKPFDIPVKFGFATRGGKDRILRLEDGSRVKDGLLRLREKQQTFKFKSIAKNQVPSLFRDFSAPVNVKFDLDDKSLMFQMAHDANLFNRWQASQTLLTRQLANMITRLGEKKPAGSNARLVKAIGKIVKDDRLDPSYRALFLALPTRADLLAAMDTPYDPALHFRARTRLLKSMAKTLSGDLEIIYNAHAIKEDYAPVHEQIGRRSLRAACLNILASSGKDDHFDMAYDHFKSATNMSDQVTGLRVLNHHKTPLREKALAEFYDQWHGDHLVIDKWFALQAMSPLPGATARIRKLMRLDEFDLKNPNKVRALIGTFASANAPEFHHPSGRGYKFVADTLLRIDRFNPQIAARLFNVFRIWPKLENGRRILAKQTLLDALKAPKLSKNSYEIIKRISDG